MQTAVAELGGGMSEWVETTIGEQATLQRGIDIKKAKLKDPEHICASNYDRLWERIISYLTECLSNGIKSGEFREMSVSDTANILIALINGLIRQQVYKLDDFSGIRGSAVSFCRFSLVNL